MGLAAAKAAAAGQKGGIAHKIIYDFEMKLILYGNFFILSIESNPIQLGAFAAVEHSGAARVHSSSAAAINVQQKSAVPLLH